MQLKYDFDEDLKCVWLSTIAYISMAWGALMAHLGQGYLPMFLFDQMRLDGERTKWINSYSMFENKCLNR